MKVFAAPNIGEDFGRKVHGSHGIQAARPVLFVGGQRLRNQWHVDAR